VTSVFGLVFGVPPAPEGLYLAIATLAAHFITTYGIIHWERMTNGVLGFNVAPATVVRPAAGLRRAIFYLIFALVVPAVFFAKNLFRTKIGRGSSRCATATWRPRSSREPLPLTSCSRSSSALLRGRGRGPHGPPLAHRVPRRVQPARGHRLPGHDHHRRHGSILGSIYGAVFMTLLPEVLKLSATSLTGVYRRLRLIASVRDIVFAWPSSSS